jgi:ribulose-5-phosphate 4-epimerase/fuculose-1-phosphate aldolase
LKAVSISEQRDEPMLHRRERVALAASFRWAARLNLHEGVANHFSLAVNDGTHFLLNPNQRHFSRIRASDLLLLDVDDMAVMERDDAPDPTAWGLHGSVHRHCPRARCIMHAHPIYSTVLASLADSNLPPIDQNTAIFFNRYVIDNNYGGLAFSEEGQRCAELLSRNECKVMIMGNHGIMAIGNDVADTFNRLYYFERAAETYVKALWTQKPLRILADELAERTAQALESYPGQGDRHFNELLAILDAEEPDYAD